MRIIRMRTFISLQSYKKKSKYTSIWSKIFIILAYLMIFDK